MWYAIDKGMGSAAHNETSLAIKLSFLTISSFINAYLDNITEHYTVDSEMTIQATE